jgi:predicted transcriptional regulator
MIENVAAIVSAYMGKNRVDPAELPALIQRVSRSLAGPGKAEAEAPTSLTPAISIRRSVGADTMTCLDCGSRQRC